MARSPRVGGVGGSYNDILGSTSAIGVFQSTSPHAIVGHGLFSPDVPHRYPAARVHPSTGVSEVHNWR